MADPQAPRLISKVEQLTGSDLSMADDLIKELAVKMKYNLVWTPETVPSERNAYWHQVFYRWGTVSGPGQLPQLQARDKRSSTLVGQLSQTLPQIPKKPRKVLGGHSRAPSEASRKARQHFADVFLKPSVNIDTDTVSFIWSDSIGGIINPQFVTLTPGLDLVHAKSRAIRHWDTMEEDRIFNYNSSMCIYWARNRLLRKVLSEAGRHEEVDRIPDEEGEGLNKLVTLHTCTEVLARTAEILRAIQEDISRVPSARRWLPEYKA